MRAADAGADAHNHIVPRLRLSRRLYGVLICKRIYRHIREFVLNRVRHGVDKPDQRSGIGAFLLIDLGAFFAGAIRINHVRIVLRNGHDLRIGIGSQPFPDLVDRNLQHVRIRQAKLAVQVL